MVKIAFSGKFTSGKSTAAGMIKDEIQIAYRSCKIISFAGKLKEIATELFGMTKKDRKLLIKLGKKMREIEEDVWLNYAVRDSKEYGDVVIDDLRFPNEYEKLKKEGFVLVRIHVEKDVQLQRIKDLYDDWENHVEKLNDISETALDNYQFDYCIHSDTKESMKLQLKRMLNDIRYSDNITF